jgi:hypothetical protein
MVGRKLGDSSAAPSDLSRLAESKRSFGSPKFAAMRKDRLLIAGLNSN